MDTAPFGDIAAWQHSPTSGVIEDGWLYGRGAADSKVAITIFLHVARQVRDRVASLSGTLTLLFDADEHTGFFGGAKRYFGGPDRPRDVDGVMIGYPGPDELVVGGRGFLRAELMVPGRAGHTGSERSAVSDNAVERAADLVQALAKYRSPGPIDTALTLPPKLTVTAISGRESYSIMPDHCSVKVDVRLTTTFDRTHAEKLLREVVTQVDERWSTDELTAISFHESWPAYHLRQDAPIRSALIRATQNQMAAPVVPKVAGPSNIGNYLAELGIDATAGFGVRYEGLHGTNERIDVTTIPSVQATYHEAALRLLTP